MEELQEHLRSKASFFLGGRVALRVGERSLSVDQLRKLGTMLEDLGMTLWAVEAEHPLTQLAAQELGLETATGSVMASPLTEPERISREEMAGIVIFLASPSSDFITGQTIYIDGGWTAW